MRCLIGNFWYVEIFYNSLKWFFIDIENLFFVDERNIFYIWVLYGCGIRRYYVDFL